jgi:hypothetical protein
MKVDVVSIPRDEGFGLTIVAAVANAADGTPLDGLAASNFEVVAIQGPSGWAEADQLHISSGLFEPLTGVYAFAVDKAGKKVPSGRYTLAVVVKGSKGSSPVHGQTLATASIT